MTQRTGEKKSGGVKRDWNRSKMTIGARSGKADSPQEAERIACMRSSLLTNLAEK